MITFTDITKLFSVALNNKRCIEIEFRITGSSNYQDCWMGKMPEKDTRNALSQLPQNEPARDIYWFGFPSGETSPRNYDTFSDFSTAPVFDGKSLEEIWDRVEILSIDGCDPAEIIQFYI